MVNSMSSSSKHLKTTFLQKGHNLPLLRSPSQKVPQGYQKNVALGDDSVATVANAFSQPSGRDPMEESATPGGMDADYRGNTLLPISIQGCPQRRHTQINKRRDINQQIAILFPRLNLAHTRAERSALLLLWTKSNVLRNAAVRKVNPRTLQPRHHAMFIFRLGQTIHDQNVTVVQPNRRENFARCATNLELHRIA